MDLIEPINPDWEICIHSRCYLLYLKIILFILYFSCSPDYVGEYCQYKNPCNTGEQKCLNGGTCNVLFSNNQPPTFQVNSSYSLRHLLCLWFRLKFSNITCCLTMNLFYYTVRFWVLQTNTYHNSKRVFVQCTCPVGFTASLCEVPVENVCDSSPCRNGGSCHLSSLSRYTCTCPLGWKGRIKHQDVNILIFMFL